MKISDKGLEALIAEEGEVLRAYKDTAGIWTIGVGLTKASGVIDPKPGMTITKEQSRTLLRRALERSYEPETEVAMSAVQGSAVTRPSQSEKYIASWRALAVGFGAPSQTGLVVA